MVECESERYFKRLDFTNVLIDTWWNVNTAIVSTWTPPLLF